MKHRFTTAYYDYWDQKRGYERAPERADLDPDDISAMLGDIFVLNANFGSNYPFRVAGPRVGRLLGSNLRHVALTSLFEQASDKDLHDIIEIVTTEQLVVVAGVVGAAATGGHLPLELLLMPLRSDTGTRVNASVTGLIVPLQPFSGRVDKLELISHRYLSHPPQKLAPRLLRKWQVARGVMVYEGFR